ncbi:MAG: radical SAM family heme chaperone HemW [Candidatus Magnetominusculus sp. LBB02]|nr:radical SAM family heme chaperone HemW [Candidatus Magnetominusculus sp. LBB02]
MIGNLYIHIPFCLRKCPYCDFFSIPYDKEMEGRYCSALMHELTLRKDAICPLNTIYIGGGTPTVFEAGTIARLIEFINSNFGIENGAEITLEANPSSVSDEKLRLLRDCGVNRISIGIQSFDDMELKALGRLHNSTEAAAAIDIIRKYFGNFSIDLIYGVEGQGVEGWLRSVRTALSFSPLHISAYELTPEPATPFGRRVVEGDVSLPVEDDIAAMYDGAALAFARAGLCHYEISNFAVDGFQCRHNQNYWRRGLYIGIGAGAHSHLTCTYNNTVRSSNSADIAKYLNAIENNTLPTDETTVIDERQRLKETIFLGLRTAQGISAAEADVDCSELQPFIEHGLADLDGGRFKLTRKGFLVSNQIIGRLIAKI